MKLFFCVILLLIINLYSVKAVSTEVSWSGIVPYKVSKVNKAIIHENVLFYLVGNNKYTEQLFNINDSLLFISTPLKGINLIRIKL